jgi:hypothetical protein
MLHPVFFAREESRYPLVSTLDSTSLWLIGS